MSKQNFSDKLIILIVITILFYIAILLYSDLNLIIDRIYQIRLDFIPIILSLMAIQFVILGIKFHRMLKKLGILLPLNESIRIFVAGISLIATPGGMGTAIKSHIIKKKHGVPVLTTLPIIFVERLTELLGILIILTIFLYWTGMYESIIAVVLGLVFIIIMFFLISNNRIFNSIKKIITKINKIKKFAFSLDKSKDSLSKLMEKNTFFESLGWSIIAKFAQFAAVYFIFLSLNIDLGFILSGQIYYTALILGALTLIPSGIIITESTMIAILLQHNVEFSLAALLVLFTRLFTTWLGTILGIISLKLMKI